MKVYGLSEGQGLDRRVDMALAADHVSAAGRPSTRKVYDAKWSDVASWCRTEKYNPDSASPRIVADFYMFRKKKCQVITVKGYRSMTSNTLKFKSGINIGSGPIISEHIKSFEIQRPVQRS